MIQLLEKCLRGNIIAPLQHACFALLGTCAEGVQFYCLSCTYPAIPYCISTYYLSKFLLSYETWVLKEINNGKPKLTIGLECNETQSSNFFQNTSGPLAL